MADKQSQCEGPGELGKPLFKPGDARNMPTKHYPDSGNLGKTHGKVDIDGPSRGK